MACSMVGVACPVCAPRGEAVCPEQRLYPAGHAVAGVLTRFWIYAILALV
jgi:hypothetical protein